jgi:TolB-like protein/Tfp pilus assembly protein PilF
MRPDETRSTLDPRKGGEARLESWKDIAAYLKRSVSTVQRWEKQEGLPVHRLQHSRLGTLYAYPSELDAWWAERRQLLDQEPQETDGDPAPSADVEGVMRDRRAPRLTMAAVTLLVAAGSFYLWSAGRQAPDPIASASTRAIAVLPLQNLSPHAEDEYFAEGMTEELVTKLSRIHSLQVAARSSVARYKKDRKDARQVGREVGVRYLLDGSVRKDDGRVRIAVQLIDTSTGFHLWADDFEGDLKDVFAAQEETALKVAEALDLRLSPQEDQAVRRRYTQNPEAYDAYLRGWALLEGFHGSERPERLAAVRRHFERALTLDPEYAPALAGLSLVEGFTIFFGVDASPEHIERAEILARRALALDPQLSEAHIALGDVYGFRNEWARAIEAYRQGLRLDPESAYGWEELAWALNSSEPPNGKEAERAAREAVRLLPGWFWAHYQLGWALRLQGRHAEAIDALEYTLQLNPGFSTAHVALGEVHLAQGEFRRALDAFDKARSKKTSMALRVLIGAAHAGLGDHDRAFAELERALEGGYRRFATLETSPEMASLRADPRFSRLISRYRR